MNYFFVLVIVSLLLGCEQQTDRVHSPLSAPASTTPNIVRSDKWNELKISKKEFGGVYPFSVTDGILRCEFNQGHPLVYFGADGSMYAINGSAKTASPNLPSIDKIWADNPAMPQNKLSMVDVIDEGLALCEK